MNKAQIIVFFCFVCLFVRKIFHGYQRNFCSCYYNFYTLLLYIFSFILVCVRCGGGESEAKEQRIAFHRGSRHSLFPAR